MNLPTSRILESVKAGDLSDAVSILLDFTKASKSRFYREIILHSANLQQVLREERLGTASPSSVKREKDRITLALIDLLDELIKENHTDNIELLSYNMETPVSPRESIEREEKSKGVMRVFLCHSSIDKPTVRQIYNRLQLEKGIDPWLDVEKLLPGVDWDFEIKSAVRSSHVVLVFLSRNSINKEGYIQKEIKHALDIADEKPDGTIFIVPLRLEDCEVPDRLKKWQWLDLFEKNSYDKLLISLRKRADDLATKGIGI